MRKEKSSNSLYLLDVVLSLSANGEHIRLSRSSTLEALLQTNLLWLQEGSGSRTVQNCAIVPSGTL